MKRSRYSEEQIIGILKEHQAGMSAVDLCRKYGFSDATFYKWRSKYGGMDVSDAKRLKALEEEPQAEEASGGVDAGQFHSEGDAGKKLLTPGSRRKAVDWAMKEKEHSQRRSFWVGVSSASGSYGHSRQTHIPSVALAKRIC
jgi:putative transposase